MEDTAAELPNMLLVVTLFCSFAHNELVISHTLTYSRASVQLRVPSVQLLAT